MKIVILLLVLGLCMISCDDQLDVLPENSLTLNNALTTPQDFESAISGVEQKLRYTFIENSPMTQELKGFYVDEIADWVAGWSTNEYTSEEIVASNMNNWHGYYSGIAAANAILNRVDDVSFSQERRNIYKGQALFFKAVFYLRLVQRWGNCILVKDDVIYKPTAKSPWEEVTDYAIELSGEAVDLLPEFDKMTNWKGENYANKATPGKGAANALLAYLCAWKAGCKYFASNQNYDEKLLWEQVEKACTSIIGSGTYSLEPNPEAVCTSGLIENSQESIYETINRGYEYELSDFESMALVNLLAFYGAHYVGYPFNPFANEETIKNSDYKIKVATVNRWFTNGDLRKEAYFYKVDELAEKAGGNAHVYKYRGITYMKESGAMCGLTQNRVWWRLADIYLLRAESRVRLGDMDGAIADLNEIRERAGAKCYESSEDSGDLRYTIFLERQKELLLEGHRYFDVIRNGYVNTELKGNFGTLSVQDIKDGALFMCIGNMAFTNNPLMRQNAYWFRRM
ncbi:RagB/SusD family nutrient uptake outer membrane protein [Butyricimonas sp. Marseille-P3923]|uniref:RagB/SusD family nutrient uptake outer membrane protein n=1 Tax=Butyricimonas sp. Marseille-P3923 TaxID=1987504 RepID=UPI00159B9BAA|nr:RagB/SusD family nutrient uptake outer membrane protein [Butyricimonas sp. Marseille-P3923]